MKDYRDLEAARCTGCDQIFEADDLAACTRCGQEELCPECDPVFNHYCQPEDTVV